MKVKNNSVLMKFTSQNPNRMHSPRDHNSSEPSGFQREIAIKNIDMSCSYKNKKIEANSKKIYVSNDFSFYNKKKQS